MPKLVFFPARRFAILETEGFLRVRQKGSHTILQKRTEQTTITVPVPMHRTIRIGTLQSIIRQSRLPRLDSASLHDI